MKYLFITLFTLFTFFSCKQEVTMAEPIKRLDEGDLDLAVYDEDGFQSFLHQKDDKVYVINFWATWCLPCLKEMPFFEQIQKENPEDVEVILVSLNNANEFESMLVPFVKRKNLVSKVIAVEPKSSVALYDSVDKTWKDGGIPATLVYNKHKRYFIKGETTYNELNKLVQEFKQ